MVFKPKYRDKQTGEPVESRVWWYEFKFGGEDRRPAIPGGCHCRTDSAHRSRGPGPRSPPATLDVLPPYTAPSVAVAPVGSESELASLGSRSGRCSWSFGQMLARSETLITRSDTAFHAITKANT